MVDAVQDTPRGDDGRLGGRSLVPGVSTRRADAIQARAWACVVPCLPEESAGGSHGALNIVREAEIETFVRLILADDQPAVLDIAQRIMGAPGGREILLSQLLTPAARYLGRLWEQDLCDFTDVTIGTYRLDRLMKETEFADGGQARLHYHQHRALLLPAPGEQHRFGVAMLAEVFRAGGWRVRTGAAVARDRLVRLVRDEWFDLVGLSISSERSLGSVAACVRAIRQVSRNNRLLIFLGGHAFTGHEERSRFLGADMTAADAYQALEDGNMMMASLGNRVSQSTVSSVHLDMR